jgi:hypothetical protein
LVRYSHVTNTQLPGEEEYEMSVPPLMIPPTRSARTSRYHIEHRPASPESPVVSYPVGPLEPLAKMLESLGEGGELVIVDQANERVVVRCMLGDDEHLGL